MVIKHSNGNVGIGTNNPQQRLDIQGTNATLRILDPVVGGSAVLALKEYSNNLGYDIAYNGTDDKLYIRAYNNSATPRVDMTFDRSSGQVVKWSSGQVVKRALEQLIHLDIN
jgi:hypothetical protein